MSAHICVKTVKLAVKLKRGKSQISNMAAFCELWCPVPRIPYLAIIAKYGSMTSSQQLLGSAVCFRSCSSQIFLILCSFVFNFISVCVNREPGRMSTTDLESQDSVDAESSEYDDDEDGEDDYYTNVDDDEGMASDKEEDPESFEFVIIDSNEAQQMFDSLVAKTSQEIKVRCSTLASDSL